MKELIGTIKLSPDDFFTDAEVADKMDELRRERDRARAEADLLRPVASAALHLSEVWAEFEGDPGAVVEHLDALWKVCDAYKATPL